jgi:hypothetical protein
LSFSLSYFQQIMYKDVEFGAKKVKIFNRKNKKEIIFNLFIQTLICSSSSIYLRKWVTFPSSFPPSCVNPKIKLF